MYYSIKKLLQLKSEKYLSDLTKCKHYLNITNSGKLDEDGYLSVKHINNVTSTEYLSRAASFDLIFFAIPMDWDGGNGYDFKEGVNGESLISTNGATWNRCRNGAFWNEAGVYCNGTLSLEYDKFSSPEGSGIIMFGFSSCPWCQAIVPILYDIAKEEMNTTGNVPFVYNNTENDYDVWELG